MVGPCEGGEYCCSLFVVGNVNRDKKRCLPSSCRQEEKGRRRFNENLLVGRTIGEVTGYLLEIEKVTLVVNIRRRWIRKKQCNSFRLTFDEESTGRVGVGANIRGSEGNETYDREEDILKM